MEVFRAVSDFSAPSTNSNILSFQKGDTFEVFESQKTGDWWGARRISDNSIGYVPSKYLQYEERRIGSVLPENYHEHRETHLKRFAAMQNSDHHKHPEELYSEIPEPDPDYQNDDDTTDFPPPPPPLSTDDGPHAASKEIPCTSPTSPTGPAIIGVKNGGVGSPDEDGHIIQPRKLSNPCLESRERQMLHKELLMNYKLGKDVLKKPELNKVIQKRKDAQKKKEWDEAHANKRTSLELKLEERANRLKEDDAKMKSISEDKDEQQPELMRMHRRITTKAQSPPS